MNNNGKMEIKEKKELKVTVDKKHIVSIGERLYAELVGQSKLLKDAFAEEQVKQLETSR